VAVREQKLIVSLVPMGEEAVAAVQVAREVVEEDDHTPDLLPLTISPWGDEERRVGRAAA
jgi:hypothetical protein